MVFKSAMTSDYSRMDSLSLIGQRISTLSDGNSLMRRMNNLKELNLASNKIVVVNQLNELKGLQTLILSSNRI